MHKEKALPPVKWPLVLLLVYLAAFTLIFWSTNLEAAEEKVRPASAEGPVLRPELKTLEHEGSNLQNKLGSLVDSLTVYYVAGNPAIWCPDGHIEDRAEAMIEVLESARAEGLHPERYHPEDLRTLHDAVKKGDTDDWPRLEVYLSASALLYAKHVSSGSADPKMAGVPWFTEREHLPLVPVLERMARSSGSEIEKLAAELAPPHDQYRKLRSALDGYRKIAAEGGWPSVPDGESLEPGDMAGPERVHLLAQRLDREGFEVEVPDRPGDSDVEPVPFADDLVSALMMFQSFRGIEPDGVLGPDTLGELNISAEDRVRTIELNMDRWRWMPRSMERKHIQVNTASFELKGMKDGSPVLRMRVITGKKTWSTPAFSDEMTTVVFNPEWNVPRNIFVDEVAIEAVEDEEYLEKNNMVVLDRETQEPVGPDKIDWDKPEEEAEKYLVRQLPGPGNPLGQIKFLFPNEFSIYLHDTPKRHLFEETDRAFSHGCVRVEQPIELAVFVFESDPEWTRWEIEKAYQAEERVVVTLKEKIPVYILYWTAIVGEDGILRFHQDQYGIDRSQAQNLSEVGEDELASVIGTSPK